MGNAPKWHTLGQSVRGASHVRSGLPNQDAITWEPTSGDGPPLIVAVSDGHGSPRSFRSDVGSRFAVEQTVALIKDLLNVADNPPTLSAVKRLVEERLPQELVRRWRQAVDAHHNKHPFTKEELDQVADKRGEKARREAERDPHLAYGATILSTLVMRSFILYLQLGDGDILSVMEDNTVTRPVPGDERLFANQTTSLCTRDAWRDVRYRFQPLYGPQPALILLSSDGYANSFVSDQGFLKVGSDILDILREDGIPAVADNLENWLTDASKSGSGDDITLAILYRDDIPGDPTHEKTPVEKPEIAPPAPIEILEQVKIEADIPAAAPIEQAHKDKDAADEGTTLTPETPPSDDENVTTPEPVKDEPAAPEIDKAQDGEQSQDITEDTDLDEAAKRKRRIKDEDGPYEPSKKAPTIYYED